MVLGIALLAFIGEVFAAPTLTGPTETVNITETTATLVGYVENPYKTSLVWFEWTNSSSLDSFTTVGMTRVFDRGFFRASLTNLNPGTTYYYRSASSEGGATVYSPIISFRTKGGTTATVTQTVTYQNTTAVNTSATAPVTTPTVIYQNTATAPVTQTATVVSAQTKKPTTSTVVAKKTTSVAKTTTATKEGFSNVSNNTAAVIGAEGLLPRTLIGWVALLIALLVVIILFLKIYESSEKQKKARKAKRIQEGEEAKEEISDIEKILEKNR